MTRTQPTSSPSRPRSHSARASPAPDAQFTIDPNVIVDAATVAARPERVLLIDARAAEHFGDETQHIPGAVSLPSSLLAAEGRVHVLPGC